MIKNEGNIVVPNPTYIYRLLHLENLEALINRLALHAPNHVPSDGLSYKPIHNLDVQARRMNATIPCGMRGVLHDYVPFYFGRWSPMLLQLKTGQVKGYNEGQEPLLYLVSTVQEIATQGLNFVYSDGHGVVAYTKWYDDLKDLDKVDWSIVDQHYWSDNSEDGDRKRRKQAEFLVYQKYPWDLIKSIMVFNRKIKLKVEAIFCKFSNTIHPSIQIEPGWYY